MEASSHALALDRLRCCDFAACGLTNITADHIEFHGSWEEYFQAKARLFTELGAGKPAILNADDEHFDRLAGMLSNPIVSYSQEGKGDVRASQIEPENQGTRCLIEAGGERADVVIPLPGRFNVSNTLAAVSLALIAGLALPHIAEALRQVRPPPGRMERIEAGQPFDVIVDYAHTMNAFCTVLATLRERLGSPGRLIAVFGATGSRDRGKRPVLAQIARRYTDFFIITDEDPYEEQPERIIDEIACGVPPEEEGTRFARELDRGSAIETALRRALPGDAVVILGKGHERSMVVNGQKRPWSDVDAVRAILEGMQ
jgi:UDP-N-acetylmuramoyl-L-alanyl-D-glutamate--2,6-diaminopimelate ligase